MCLCGAGSAHTKGAIRLLTAQACLLQGFEPVMLALAKDVTWYDERFRGPFGARTAQALDMSQHLTFEVNPLDFVVHIPFVEPEHVRTSADAVYDQVRACSGTLGSPAGRLSL